MRNDCVFCAIVAGNPAKVVRKLTAAGKLKCKRAPENG